MADPFSFDDPADVATGDVLTEADCESMFRQALSEKEFEPDSVEVVAGDEFMVSHGVLLAATKMIGGKRKRAQARITIEPTDNHDRVASEIVKAANNIVSSLRDRMQTEIVTCNTALVFSTEDGGKAWCKLCGNSVSFRDIQHSSNMFSQEMSTASASYYDLDRHVRKMSGVQKEGLKLYLLGALRRKCSCDFGEQNRKI